VRPLSLVGNGSQNRQPFPFLQLTARRLTLWQCHRQPAVSSTARGEDRWRKPHAEALSHDHSPSLNGSRRPQKSCPSTTTALRPFGSSIQGIPSFKRSFFVISASCSGLVPIAISNSAVRILVMIALGVSPLYSYLINPIV
jgi:hypothetical protein